MPVNYVCISSTTTQLLAILGEQFIVGNEICGAVISVRPNEDIIALWNRTASNPAITGRIRYVESSYNVYLVCVYIRISVMYM